MRILKYVVAFALPILLFFNLWRVVRFGDDYTYRGFHEVVDYLQTYPGFENTYNALTNESLFYHWQWYDGVADFFTGGANSLVKLLIGPISVVVSCIIDIFVQIGWFFGWIFSMTN